MQPAPTPIDESFRLEALKDLNLLDTAPEDHFDAIVRLGRKLFDVETCLISLVDANRQWFKAAAGLDARETPRNVSFCGHAIMGDVPFVIRDAKQDDRFHDNPLVTGPPHVRFYAGMPLRIPTGYKLGTLCILSPRPRDIFSPDDEARLIDLANLTVNTIALGALREAGDKLRAEFDRYATLFQITSAPLAMISPTGLVEECNEAFDSICGVNAKEQRIESLLRLPENWRATTTANGEIRVPSLASHTRFVTIYPCDSGYMAAG